ncbi:proline-rich protein [Streptomyces lincolnensis]|uniref:Proline-rich protein n=1 Tax=Streptomyces lincolnensis TaxID=1915 RepID=A0A1B1MF40_STRLN|nr:SCO3374 family protein [Streptomyces lincolnensis]ANS67012.1 proline-rich protein [Streptomyces lincolnensis]AXG55884.1 proline-rich protein [Streptomyces lincolnensis]QMV07639.1 hypothetical protein GJU35_19465 [Streptomyces lincolnensis]
MSGALPPVVAGVASVPLPRRPLEHQDHQEADDRVRHWYENELGWETVPGSPGTPLRLRVGLRFDVLDVPAEAGRAALRHLAPGSPVALRGDRVRLLVAAGGAQEVPGILDWLEWGTLPLGLRTIGEGGTMEAPLPGPNPEPVPEPLGVRPLPPGRSGTVQGAAVWLRPPEPGYEVEASLPTLSAVGGDGSAPELVRVLNTVATHCHRLRLRRTSAQPPMISRTRH